MDSDRRLLVCAAGILLGLLVPFLGSQSVVAGPAEGHGNPTLKANTSWKGR